jgi:hypothetical protein
VRKRGLVIAIACAKGRIRDKLRDSQFDNLYNSMSIKDAITCPSPFQPLQVTENDDDDTPQVPSGNNIELGIRTRRSHPEVEMSAKSSDTLYEVLDNKDTSSTAPGKDKSLSKLKRSLSFLENPSNDDDHHDRDMGEPFYLK